jgi:hypothetical protein
MHEKELDLMLHRIFAEDWEIVVNDTDAARTHNLVTGFCPSNGGSGKEPFIQA